MSNTKKTSCKECGGLISFNPADQKLTCPYCGFQQEIAQTADKVVELDFHKYLQKLKNESSELCETALAKCQGCGAQVTLKENEQSLCCPFCETQVTSESHSSRMIKPSSLIPFSINEKQAFNSFKKWLQSLWFAPNKLKKALHHQARNLQGIYVPYWTYDSQTCSFFTGQRGDDYYTTEKDSQGNTKRVRHTRWTKVSGNINKFFNDILIIADKTLPKNQAESLEPWDLAKLTDYKESFLSGFRTVYYQTELDQGFEEARTKIDKVVRKLVRNDIGGDHQRILQLDINCSDITFKHILLPVWLSSFRYGKKVYRFLVNGQSGEVQGERPYSIPKIIAAVTFVVTVIGLVVYYN